MEIEGHYDEHADITWLRFEGHDPARVVAEEDEFGLRETDPTDGRLVGLEFWRASKSLPRDLLSLLPSPPASAPR
jgi:uncharacterized protein YuzE